MIFKMSDSKHNNWNIGLFSVLHLIFFIFFFKLTHTILIASLTSASQPLLKHLLRIRQKIKLNKTWLFYFVCPMWITSHRKFIFVPAFSGCGLMCVRCSGMFVVMQFKTKWHVSALIVKVHTRMNFAIHNLLRHQPCRWCQPESWLPWIHFCRPCL